MSYEDLAPKIQELKRQGRDEEALALLVKWMDRTEKSARRTQAPVESWPYWQTCVILRKLKRYGEEVEVIERFLGQPSSGSKQSQELIDRLDKAYHLAGLTEIAATPAGTIAYYIPEGVPVDERALFVRDAVLVDTETTGRSHADEPIEIALLRFRYSHYSGRILAEVDSYVGRRQPSCPISPQAARVHGISMTDVTGRQLDQTRIREVIAGASMALAHNASFDQRMVGKVIPELEQLPWRCTMNGIDWLAKGCESRKQVDICAHYGLRYPPHGADADVRALLALLSTTDEFTGRPLMHELIRDMPLGYVSTWQAQQERHNDHRGSVLAVVEISMADVRAETAQRPPTLPPPAPTGGGTPRPPTLPPPGRPMR